MASRTGEPAGDAEPDGGDAPVPGTASGQQAPSLPASQTRMVQLFLDSITQPQFLADCQNVLVFVKGDAKRATVACGSADFGDAPKLIEA